MRLIKIVDPVTRIEGHMKAEVSIDQGTQAMDGWLDEPDGSPSYDGDFDQRSGIGVGMSEAPRGAPDPWGRPSSGPRSGVQSVHSKPCG